MARINNGRINKSYVKYGKLAEVIQKLDKKISIKVGILGKNGAQPVKGTDLSMADLGAVHEFGATINVPAHDSSVYRSIDSDGNFKYGGKFRKRNLKSTNWQEDYHIEAHQTVIPSRSFLRAALLTPEGKKALQVWTVDEKEALINYLNNDSVSANVLAATIGQKGLARVLEAFDTGGFGEWAPIKTATRRNRTESPDNPPLEDTGDLKGSITFEVKEL